MPDEASTPAPAADSSNQPIAPDPLATLTAELESTRQTLESIRRERDAHKALFEAGVNDLDIGAVLLERDMQAAPGRTVPELIADLKKRKPSLFARPATAPATSTPAPTSTMGPRTRDEDPRRAAAAKAAHSGDRSSLMTYLRLRRQPA
jgi:lysophospholipase L1-like esterase